MPTRAASGRNCGVLARCSRLSSSRSISLTITWYLTASGAIRSASKSMVYGSRVLLLLRVAPCQVNENLRTPAEQSGRKTRGVKCLTLADDFVRVANLNRG